MSEILDKILSIKKVRMPRETYFVIKIDGGYYSRSNININGDSVCVDFFTDGTVYSTLEGVLSTVGYENIVYDKVLEIAKIKYQKNNSVIFEHFVARSYTKKDIDAIIEEKREADISYINNLNRWL